MWRRPRAGERRKLVVVGSKGGINSAAVITCQYASTSASRSPSSKPSWGTRFLAGKTLKKRITHFARKIREKYKRKAEFISNPLRGKSDRTRPTSHSDVLDVLQTRHHVKTKCIPASGPGHAHKEESLLRASKRDPTRHLVLGKRTRASLDSDRETHEQSRSSHRQFIRCTRSESLLVQKRGCSWWLIGV